MKVRVLHPQDSRQVCGGNIYGLILVSVQSDGLPEGGGVGDGNPASDAVCDGVGIRCDGFIGLLERADDGLSVLESENVQSFQLTVRELDHVGLWRRCIAD